MSTFNRDFSVIADTALYAAAPFTYPDDDAAIVSGAVVPASLVARTVVLHNDPLITTAIMDATVTVNFDSAAFPLASAGVGIFDKDTLLFYGIRFRFDAVSIRRITSAGVVEFIGDTTVMAYAPGDTFTFRVDPTLTPMKMKAYKNGVFYKTIDAPITNFSNYRLGFFVQHDSGSNTGGMTAIDLIGLQSAVPASITAVNGGAAVTQYQQAVPVTYAGLDPATITAMTLNGIACTYTAAGAFNAPGSLSPGTYTLQVVTPTDTITAEVPYTRTHPIQVPPAGTTVHVDSVFGQMGNPGGRYISLTKPAELTWKSPYTEFTAENCALALTDVLEAPSGAVDGTSYNVTGSLIDPDGVTAAFTVAAVVDAAVEPPPPDPDPEVPGEWPYGLQLKWKLAKAWFWGRRHPKTNQRIRLWKKER